MLMLMLMVMVMIMIMIIIIIIIIMIIIIIIIMKIYFLSITWGKVANKTGVFRFLAVQHIDNSIQYLEKLTNFFLPYLYRDLMVTNSNTYTSCYCSCSCNYCRSMEERLSSHLLTHFHRRSLSIV